MKNVMVDLETLSTESNAVILSIGAVEFDETGIGREFYVNIDPQSCVNNGLVIDVSTIMWWMRQSDQARKAFDAKGSTLFDALVQFSEWFEQTEATDVWGNGATFDNVILTNAYKAVGGSRPWSYRGDRCYRTLKEMFPTVQGPFSLQGTAHNTLDDACWQAFHCVELLKAVNGVAV